MKKLRILAIFFAVLFTGVLSYAQEQLVVSNQKIDDNLRLIKSLEDTVTILNIVNDIHHDLQQEKKAVQAKVYFEIALVYYRRGMFQNALHEIENSIILSKVMQEWDIQADALRLKGRIERRMLQYDKSFMSLKSALVLYERTGNVERQFSVYNAMGIIHKDIGNYVDALTNYHKAYEIADENDLLLEQALACVNIGVILKKEDKYEEAIQYYERAEKIYLKENYVGGLADIYNNIGNIYRLKKNYHFALSFYHLAIANRKEANEEKRLAYTYNNISLVYTELKQFDKAIESLLKAEEIKLKYGDLESLSSTYLNLSDIYLELNDRRKYEYYRDKARENAIKYHQDDIRRDVILNNSKFEAKNKNYKKAYIYLSNVYEELDTLDVESQKVLTSVLQAQFEDAQDEKQIHDLSDAIILLDQQKNELENTNKKLNQLIWFLIVSLLFLVVLSILFYKKHIKLKEKTTELEKTTVSIEEKELLLKEIHHRVKNNLQIIKSLIRLQNSEDRECMDRGILTDFELRVSSMALVHESLYKKGNLATINVQDYFENLIENLINVYQLKYDVEVENNIEVLELDIDTLVPLGLLSTEIISNSMKYGVASLKNGKITVFLKPLENERYELIIRDNGKGFEIKDELENNTLGIELIYTLVEQLDGELFFSNENGASYRIIFKAQVKKE